jgi:hypothetical protein
MIEESSHSRVFRQHVRDEPIEPMSLCRLQHSHGERRPDAPPLPFIADHQPDFRGAVVNRSVAAERHDFGAIGRVNFCEKRQTPTVIHTNKEAQHGLGQRMHRRKESEVPSPRAQMSVEFANRTIVAPAQRANVKQQVVRQPNRSFKIARVLKNH